MKRVLVVEAEMKQYRAPFYQGLQTALQAEGIELRVAYSAPRSSDIAKQDQCDLPEEYGLKVRGYWIFNRLLLQPLLRQAWAADLVIASEGNRFLLSHFLLPFAACKLKRLALWGLGENKQADHLAFSEWYKEKTLRCLTWWFAYTPGTARYLIRQGFPSDKITTVQNAIDTREFSAWVGAFSAAEALATRSRLGIPPSAPVGLYCGMLERVKNIPFLIESAKLVRKRLPNFHLLLVGGGAESDYVEREALLHRDWIHWVGPQFGREKALFFRIADICMMPGRVGLAVLDAFAAGLPLFCTRLPIHGPEIEYLENGRNGVIEENSLSLYTQAVVNVLDAPLKLAALKAGANLSCAKYSIETMIANFRQGIVGCLARS